MAILTEQSGASPILVFFTEADESKARVLAELLTKSGWRTGLSDPPSKRIAIEVVRRARCVIVLWSKACVADDRVHLQALQAFQEGKLIQVLLEDAQPPPEFLSLRLIDLINWDGRASLATLRDLIDEFQSRAVPPMIKTSEGRLEQEERRNVSDSAMLAGAPSRDGWGIDLGTSMTSIDAAMAGMPSRPKSHIASVDKIHFTITSPPFVVPGAGFILEVWAHLDRQRDVVIERAKQAAGTEGVRAQTKGPFEVVRESLLSIRLQLEGLEISQEEDRILWDGEVGNATFAIKVHDDASIGRRCGVVTIYVAGMQIGRIDFSIDVGASASAPECLAGQEKRYAKAFASYASGDRNDVLARVQGIQKAAPQIDLFLDVVSLRSGQSWEQELRNVIPAADIFYLFWSTRARESRWVEKEWRCALEARGIDFIDPVPLESPDSAPPPPELASRHFNDWVLAFMRAGR